ncbi:hypothetical protein [Pseudomonas putida]|uniref:Oligosaccharide repeat unit polymerase n=1 Tax=Pseudomonas putida TaxID=303 RepID=A0AAW5HSM1_PSEPU|nr:hypothetical protein [Pseudomonas putida]MCO1624119.1 hypothetical protein [Pseudomonas putida]
MTDSNKFRDWLSVNIAPTIFLVSYFLTVVLGNLVYLIPSARPFLEKTPFTARIFEFDTLFSSGFWLLLLSPFVVTPLVVWLVRRFTQPLVARVVGFFPEFTHSSYLLLLLLCYGIVIYAFWQAEAFRLFLAGSDFTSSVEARFVIRERVSFFSMALLMSNLHFLSIYGAVKLVRKGGLWWGGVTLLNAVVISVLLVVLNMKWPILIFYAGLVLAVFVYTPRYPFVKAAVGMVALLLVYFLISAFVYRISPPVPEQAEQSQIGESAMVEPQVSEADIAGRSVAPVPERDEKESKGADVVALSAAIGGEVPKMMFHAVNRMAIIYPYYYEVFTKRGQVCGGLLAQAKVGQKCRPSYYIYTEIFNDQFNGRGTAPAAVHITSYALGGWPLAAVGLLCGSVLLGVFAALPLGGSSLAGAIAVTGGVMGYHLSQLPGEGPIFYDHGVFWSILMLFVYALFVKAYRAMVAK